MSVPSPTGPAPGDDEPAASPTEILELPKHRSVLIRSVRSTDKDLIAAGFRNLSPESRYLRFFATTTELADEDLAYLTEIDHRDHEALIAIERRTGNPLGVARYVKLADEPLAEVAVVVQDDWHGRGLATALLRRLSDRARDQGITHFVARMLPQNEAALGLLHAAPHVDTRMLDDEKVEAVIELPAEEGLGAGLRTSLRAAAEGLLHGVPGTALRGLFGRPTTGSGQE